MDSIFHDGMTTEEFRQAGYKMIDWICEYREKAKTVKPIRSVVKPGYLSKLVSDDIPIEGEEWEDIMKDVDNAIVPGLTHWESPNFYAYFKPSGSYPSILGELLASGLNVMGFSWIASPACTELETLSCDMLGKAFSLPPAFLSTSKVGGGVIQGSAGEAAIVVLLAARKRSLKHITDKNEQAEAFSRLTVYISDQTHSILEKACMVVGIPMDNLRKMKTSKKSDFAMEPLELQAQIEKDLKDGYIPCLVAPTIGTTNATSVDPVKAIAVIAKKFNMWCHVDAAYAGSYLVCPEFHYMLEGLDQVHSIAINTHKKLLVNFDCCVLWVVDRTPLLDALSLTPEYLRNNASEILGVIDYKDWQLPLGRRFRALKLWFTLRSYGLKGLQAHIRNGVRLASLFESYIKGSENFEMITPRKMALCVFRLKGSNELNKALLDDVNERGNIFIIHTKMEDQFVLRLAVGGAEATEEAIIAAWKELKERGEIFKAKEGEENL